jgi:hypothetical protein
VGRCGEWLGHEKPLARVDGASFSIGNACAVRP